MVRGLDGFLLISVVPVWLRCGFQGPSEGWSLPVSGGFGEGETPLPIPNRAVKPLSADGTWPFGPGRVGRRRFIVRRVAPHGAARLSLCDRGGDAPDGVHHQSAAGPPGTARPRGRLVGRRGRRPPYAVPHSTGTARGTRSVVVRAACTPGALLSAGRTRCGEWHDSTGARGVPGGWRVAAVRRRSQRSRRSSSGGGMRRRLRARALAGGRPRAW